MKYLISPEQREFLDSTVLHKTSPITDISIIGVAGCGKTDLVMKEIAGTLGVPSLRFVCQRDTARSEMLMEKTAKDGTIYDKMTRFAELLQVPSVILVDEYMLAPADVMGGLNSLLDQDRSIELPNKTVIKRHPQNIIVMCSNPSSYAGAKKQHGGFVDRMPTLRMGYSKQEREILEDRFPTLDPTLLVQLTTFADHIRGAKDNISCQVSTRGLIMMAQMIVNGAKWETAVLSVLRPSDEEIHAVSQVAQLIFGATLKTPDRGTKSELDLYETHKKKAKELEDKQKKAQESLEEVFKYQKKVADDTTSLSVSVSAWRNDQENKMLAAFMDKHVKAIAEGVDTKQWYENLRK